jgi:outer membrane protein assembly factor BamB
MREGSGLRERLERWFFFLALALLLVVTGMLLARYKIFPYPLVDDAIKGALAAAAQLGWIEDPDTGPDGTKGERSSTETGVTYYDAAAADQGLTVFSAGLGEEALLIDMNGRTVHRWSLSWSAIRERYGKEKKLPDVRVSWRSIHLYPNGDLLVTLQGENITPYGLATFKLDKDSKLLWANLENAHHDATVDENGLIYTISQVIRRSAVPGVTALEPPILEDFVLVLSPDGDIVHRISIVEAFVGTPYLPAVGEFGDRRDWKGDYFHVNAIEPYDSRNETPVLRKGQVLISIRNMDALATLDLNSGKIVWLLRGPWHRQHDPDIVNGRIMLFDNHGDFSRGGRSRVLEVDPLTQEITWQASANDQYDLFSRWGASQQPLANGNVFINEAVPARLLEVTRDGTLVWEFHASGRDESGKFAAPILEAKRYAPDDLRFQFNGG